MRRALALLAALAAIAAALAGCGGSSSTSGLDEAVGYMPKNSLAIVAIKTDPKDAQLQNVSKLVDKFPFADQIKERFKQGLRSGSAGLDYDNDIKPLLGNDVVVAVPPGGLHTPTGNAFVLAWKTKGGDIGKLVSKGSKKVGTEEGATVYQNADGSPSAVKGDTLVAAKTRTLLDMALRARNASSRMTESDFNNALGAANKDALVRVEGNFQTILATSPKSAKALKVPWVKSLGTFGVTASTASDGLSIDFSAQTSGVTADQLPLAAGTTPAPVVKRPGEVGLGLRDPAQVLRFAQQVSIATGAKSLLANKRKFSKELGVDFDKDVVAQLGPNSAASFAIDGAVAFRADVKDASRFRRTLATLLKNLPSAQRSQGKPQSKIESAPKGLSKVTRPHEKPAYVGVVGKEFVIATDPARAQEIAAQPSSPVPGTKGAVAFSADPKSLVDAILKKSGNSGAAVLIGPAIGSHLEALDGYVESETSGLRGHLKLTVK